MRSHTWTTKTKNQHNDQIQEGVHGQANIPLKDEPFILQMDSKKKKKKEKKKDWLFY